MSTLYWNLQWIILHRNHDKPCVYNLKALGKLCNAALGCLLLTLYNSASLVSCGLPYSGIVENKSKTTWLGCFITVKV